MYSSSGFTFACLALRFFAIDEDERWHRPKKMGGWTGSGPLSVLFSSWATRHTPTVWGGCKFSFRESIRLGELAWSSCVLQYPNIVGIFLPRHPRHPTVWNGYSKNPISHVRSTAPPLMISSMWAHAHGRSPCARHSPHVRHYRGRSTSFSGT